SFYNRGYHRRSGDRFRRVRRYQTGSGAQKSCAMASVGSESPKRKGIANMKIYDFTQAPNPRRVRVFLAEKGLTVPYEQINIGTADNRKPEFLKINPMGTLPVLELDDGTRIAESVAICRYFEETKPEPPLMGV